MEFEADIDLAQKYDRQKAIREIAPYMNLGIQMISPILLGALLGRWLDTKWSIAPWATVTLALLGIVLGFYLFFRTIAELGKNKK